MLIIPKFWQLWVGVDGRRCAPASSAVYHKENNMSDGNYVSGRGRGKEKIGEIDIR